MCPYPPVALWDEHVFILHWSTTELAQAIFESFHKISTLKLLKSKYYSLVKNISVKTEAESEQLEETVGELFQHLGEKPRFEAVWLGKKKDSVVRPVRVVFTSSQNAQNILVKSRNLRHANKFKRVFLSPDCGGKGKATGPCSTAKDINSSQNVSLPFLTL